MKNKLENSVSIIKFVHRSMKGLDPQEKNFIRQLRKDRNNVEVIGVYADWLEENGRTEDSLLLKRRIGLSFCVFQAFDKKSKMKITDQFSDLDSLHKELRRKYNRYYYGIKDIIDAGNIEIVKKEYFLRSEEKFKLKKEDLGV